MDPHKKGMDDTKYETPRTMRGEMQAAAPHPNSVIGRHISSRGKTGTLYEVNNFPPPLFLHIRTPEPLEPPCNLLKPP